MKSDQRDLFGILRAHWPSLLPLAALILAIIFLSASVMGSLLFFPILSFLLLVLLLGAVWRGHLCSDFAARTL